MLSRVSNMSEGQPLPARRRRSLRSRWRAGGETPPPGGGGAAPVLLAFAGSVLFHAALWAAIPDDLGGKKAEAERERPQVARGDEREVPAELLPAEMRPPPPRLVEVNPEAPTRTPPATNNTGAASQRAAQEQPEAAALGDKPRLDGEDPHSMRVANNIPRELLPARFRPIPGVPNVEQEPVSQPQAEAVPVAQPVAEASAAGGRKGERAESEVVATAPNEGARSVFAAEAGRAPALEPPKSVEPAPPPPGVKPDMTAERSTAEKKDARTNPALSPVPDKEDKGRGGKQPEAVSRPAPPAERSPKVAQARPRQDARQRGEQIDVDEPLPRPKAANIGTTGALLRSVSGVNEAGRVALDARFSEYGEYAQRFMEVVQASWWSIISRTVSNASGEVTVSFTLRKDGTLRDVLVVSTSANQVATLACKDAIESRSPFEKWPERMVGEIGDEFRTSVTFSYR